MKTAIIKSDKKKLSTQRKNELLQKELQEMGVEIFEDETPYNSGSQQGNSDGFVEDDCRNINANSEANENLNDNSVLFATSTTKADGGVPMVELTAPLVGLDVVDKEEEILRRIVSRHKNKHQSSLNGNHLDQNGSVYLTVKRG